MKLKYMIEYALRDRIREPRYEPIGVWVQGPGPGLDLVIDFLPGNADAEEDAQWVVNRLVEQGVRSLPDDFLAYHQGTLSQYRGMRSPVIKTDEYLSAEACARSVIDRIKADFIKLLDAAEPGVDHSTLAGAALKAKLKNHKIGLLRTKEDSVDLLAKKQRALKKAQIVSERLKKGEGYMC